MQKVYKTADKDRQFFQRGEKVKVFYCAPVSHTVQTNNKDVLVMLKDRQVPVTLRIPHNTTKIIILNTKNL